MNEKLRIAIDKIEKQQGREGTAVWTAFNFHFKQWRENYSALQEDIVAAEDGETKTKLRAAVAAQLKAWGGV